MFSTARRCRWVCMLVLLLVPGLCSQGLPAGPSTLLVKSGTPVELRLAETISSASARKNDSLEFVVVRDVVIDGFTVIETGTLAKGSVVGVKGKRPLGMGGNVVIRLDSVVLANNKSVGLVVLRKFKGRSHTIRMGLEMAVVGAIYWPAAPAFLLSHGSERTVLKGTDVTAYTKADALVETEDLPRYRENVSEQSEMIDLLPQRVLNGEGREGDMLNLIFLARQGDLEDAFARAGWLKADRSVPRIVWGLLRQRKHYMELPMVTLYVYGRPQDYSLVLPDPKLIVSKRHHVRIWRTGREVNGIPMWVGAATQDISIEFMMRKLRLFHRIDPNVDTERDFIARNLLVTWQLAHNEYIQSPYPVLSAQTATGQSYHSDGRLLFVELNRKEHPLAVEAEVAGTSR